MWSSLYNIMDFTAGVLPMVTINRKDMEELESYPQTKTYYKLAKEVTHFLLLGPFLAPLLFFIFLLSNKIFIIILLS